MFGGLYPLKREFSLVLPQPQTHDRTVSEGEVDRGDIYIYIYIYIYGYGVHLPDKDKGDIWDLDTRWISWKHISTAPVNWTNNFGLVGVSGIETLGFLSKGILSLVWTVTFEPRQAKTYALDTGCSSRTVEHGLGIREKHVQQRPGTENRIRAHDYMISS